MFYSCLKRVALTRILHDYFIVTGHGVPDSKVHGANIGPIWGRQDPGGPNVDTMNFAIWGCLWYTICRLQKPGKGVFGIYVQHVNLASIGVTP